MGDRPVARTLAPREWNTWVALLVALVLVLAYFAIYLAHPALPGNNTDHPLGWWGWWDQSQYLRSTRALAQGKLAPSEHWYPPAYALLAAPFSRIWPAHPFILVNLLCLIGTAWIFIAFSARLGVGPATAAILFLFASVPVAEDWVVPWTSTPTALAHWSVLLLGATYISGQRRPMLLGLAAGIVVVMRPADAVAPAVVILVALTLKLRDTPAGDSRVLAGEVLRIGIGAMLPIMLLFAVHVAIFGLKASPYMLHSSTLGFSIHAYGWKAYNLLVEPRAWWGDGVGLLQRAPWIAVAALLLPFALRIGIGVGLLALATGLHLAVYIAYIDLLPTGFWRYRNVHYLKWAMPGFALLAWLGLRSVLATRSSRRWATGLATTPVAILLCLRFVPEPVANEAGGQARAVLLRDVRAGIADTYFDARNSFTDRYGDARNISDVRFFPAFDGTRVMSLRRDAELPVVGATLYAAGPAPSGSLQVFRARLSLGWPCWLPPYVCKRGI
jgi:hypothetical protein